MLRVKLQSISSTPTNCTIKGEPQQRPQWGHSGRIWPTVSHRYTSPNTKKTSELANTDVSVVQSMGAKEGGDEGGVCEIVSEKGREKGGENIKCDCWPARDDCTGQECSLHSEKRWNSCYGTQKWHFHWGHSIFICLRFNNLVCKHFKKANVTVRWTIVHCCFLGPHKGAKTVTNWVGNVRWKFEYLGSLHTCTMHCFDKTIQGSVNRKLRLCL